MRSIKFIGSSAIHRETFSCPKENFFTWQRHQDFPFHDKAKHQIALRYLIAGKCLLRRYLNDSNKAVFAFSYEGKQLNALSEFKGINWVAFRCAGECMSLSSVKTKIKFFRAHAKPP